MHKPTKAESQLIAYKREAAEQPTPANAITRLVLSRKAGESITLGDDVRIEVVRQTSKRTVLAISAPRGLSINRSEILERVVAAAIGASPSAAITEPPELLASPTAA